MHTHQGPDGLGIHPGEITMRVRPLRRGRKRRARTVAQRNLGESVSVLSCESTLPVVLVIDNEDRTRGSLKRLLGAHGFAVITVEDGVRGLQAFRNVKPALVLVDAELPKLDGHETIKQMRREWYGAKILLMTSGRSDVHQGSTDLAVDQNADAYARKPINPARLLEALGQMLGRPEKSLQIQGGMGGEARAVPLSNQPREEPGDNAEKGA